MSKSYTSNKSLMCQIKKSDQKAFSILYDRLWDKMYIKAYAILRDESISKDIVQDIWIDFWKRRHKINNDNIEGYLLNAVRFKVYNVFRDLKGKELLVDKFIEYYNNYLSNNIDDTINLKETSKIISEIVNHLPKKCKEVFELSRYDGLKNKEIAEKLDISQRTVETHISNALKVLKSKAELLLLILIMF